MLDFGWPELFMIIVLVVLFVGPEELPRVMVALGRMTRKLQYVRYTISQQFDEVMREADLDDIRKSVNFEEGEERAFDEEAESDEAFAMMSDGGAWSDDDYAAADVPAFDDMKGKKDA